MLPAEGEDALIGVQFVVRTEAGNAWYKDSGANFLAVVSIPGAKTHMYLNPIHFIIFFSPESCLLHMISVCNYGVIVMLSFFLITRTSSTF